MIDTIKLGIPISKHQHGKLEKLAAESADWQWVMFNAKVGELRFIRHKGLAELDQQSFRREIFWDISEFYEKDNSYLTVELSLPKYWYGHNIHLLYNYVKALEELRKLFQKQLNLKLPKVDNWQVWRADICYSWRCPSQRISEQILDSIKKLHFPRKRPHIYADSVMFTGTTYSLKFYLKLPEFIAHDRKVLLKQNAKLEWVNHLEEKADGVLRCEATLRRKYLQRNGIKTVADLSGSTTYFSNDEELEENYPNAGKCRITNTLNTVAILAYMDKNTFVNVENGELVICSYLLEKFNKDYKFYAPEYEMKIGNIHYHFKGGGFSTIVKPKTVEILTKIITKLIGEHRGMETVDQVREKLLKVYKQTKASRLLGFWLYVQRLGIKSAKDDFGHNSYYVSKRALKDAGVSLIEPVKVINAQDRFIKEFKIELPSSYTTNRFDDHRDSDNLFNLPHQNDAQGS
ncbi:MAG: phage/plasmid replication protein [Cyanobacteriota bacterium]|nr:phage/plasmid replication protein [Cyanobacteriota bacterium]